MSNMRVIITEKKDVADSMATAMGWRSANGGYEGTFEGAPVRVVWARGHLLTMESPDDINPSLGWNSPTLLAPIPRAVKMLIPEEPGVEENRTLAYRMKVIKSALDAAKGEESEVILATDSDREGEYIGWSILAFYDWKKPVRRCWLTEGMDTKSMTKALSNLLPASDKKSLARAAEARARCDWAYMYLVRLLSFYGRKGLLGQHLGTGEGRESVVSIGRVQSAALYMIFSREMEIRSFVPKTFFKLLGDFETAGVMLSAEYKPKVTREIIDAQPAGVSWEPQGIEGEGKLDRPLFTGLEQVAAFEQRLMANADKATVATYDEGTKEQHPPITFDLVAAKSALSGECKISGDLAQAVIEDLYEQGFISYPRTAHGELPMALYEPAERDSRLNALTGINVLASAANRALAIHGGSDGQYRAFKPKVFVTKKLEHFGLIPTQKTMNAGVLAGMTPRKALGKSVVHTSAHMQTAYLLIAERFIQAMLPPVQLATQKITFRVPVEDLLGHPESIFAAAAERTVDAGWRGIMNAGGNKAGDLPKLTPGTASPLKKLNREEGKTKAPSRYSETNFEKAMQNAAREVNDPELRKYMADGSNKPEGIGTPATRKDIVPTLKTRGYIRADKGGTFFLEPKGEELISYLMSHGHHWMYRIDTTAEWEGRLAELTELEDDQRATADRDRFIEDMLLNIESVIDWMNEKYLGQEGVKRERTSTVTDNMKRAIKSIADRKGIKLPSGTLSDPVKAKAFLDEHAPKKEPAADGEVTQFAPSEAQMNYLAKIEKDTGVKATADDMSSQAKLNAFIDKQKATLGAKPPSEKMISYAKSLASKLPADKQPKPDVFTRADKCSAFIEKHKGKK